MNVDEIWPAIRAAFADYDKKLSPRCGPSRRKLIELRLSEGYEAEDLIGAVHGYVWFHEGLDPSPGETFNPRKWFDPDSVFKAARFDTRVEEGYRGKWSFVDPKERHQAAVESRQAAAQQRLNAARRLKEGIPLRAV
jgi:hypothetical protein